MDIRKTTGIVLIAVAVIIASVFAVDYFMGNKAHRQGTTTRDEVQVEDVTPDVSSLNEIEGPVKYEFHSSLAKNLDAVAFDAAFTEFLKKKGLLVVANGDGNATGILKAVDTGVVREDLESGAYSFDIQLYTQNADMIECTVTPDGRFAFNLYIEEGGLTE